MGAALPVEEFNGVIVYDSCGLRLNRGVRDGVYFANIVLNMGQSC